MPRFRAELKREGTETFVEGAARRSGRVRAGAAAVRGTINGSPLRSTIAKYGDDYFLGINRQVREAAGVTAGDTVEIELELDTKPRTVWVPKDLASALDVEGRAAFDRMSYSHRREYVEWIEDAKREETRRRRIAKAVAMIRQGKPPR